MDMSLEARMIRTAHKAEEFREYADAYSEIVLIGVKDRFHSHTYIHKQWSEFLKKMHVPCVLRENIPQTNKHLKKNSMVVYPDAYAHGGYKMPFRDDCSYIFHRGELAANALPMNIRLLNLYEYRNIFHNCADYPEKMEKISNFVYVSREYKKLVQPWGVLFMEYEFLPPTTCRSTKKCFFVGTVWTGNRERLKIIKQQLEKAGYDFIVKSGLNTNDEIACVRNSFVSCAPGANSHLGQHYLQCRIFKNISYGRLTFTDVGGFRDILTDCFMPMQDWTEAAKIIEILPKEYEEALCHKQQCAISNYTYLDMWTNMLKYLLMFN